MLGRFVEPFDRSGGRQVITKAAKFYLFDVGVAGYLTRGSPVEPRGAAFGRAFEHFILTELVAHASYSGHQYNIRFWRTKSGLEVDFVLGDGDVALEVKGTDRVDHRDLRPIRTFAEEYSPRAAYVVCDEPAERLAGGIRITPWRVFLRKLWSDEIMSARTIG